MPTSPSTSPRRETALENIRACLDAGVHAVVGTCGFDLDAARAKRPRSARDEGGGSANVFFAPNFAIGAVLMMRFAAEAARHMPECEIVELHHDAQARRPLGDRQAHRGADRRRRRATFTSRSTRCGCRAWSPTRR